MALENDTRVKKDFIMSQFPELQQLVINLRKQKAIIRTRKCLAATTSYALNLYTQFKG